MQLVLITDPRDNLEKARRTELVRYARQNGLNEISSAMPAIVIRRKLRALGLTSIAIPHRILGAPEVANRAAALASDDFGTGPATEIDAGDDLARQFETAAPKNPLTMTYNELRREARARNIKLGRKDRLPEIKRKVAIAMGVPIGQDPA